MSTEVVVEQLNIYPVKSLAGAAVSSATATHSGLEHDRQWIVLNEDKQMLTQRKIPAMALIQTSITENGVQLHAEGMGNILLETDTADDKFPVNVWKEQCTGVTAKAEVNQWITEALKSEQPLSIAKAAPGSIRQPEDPARFNADINTFADAAPYLVANMDSLQALNTELKKQGLEQVDGRRFRANIWLSGIAEFEEHSYAKMTTATENGYLDLIDHCSRCVMITVNPDQGTLTPKTVPFKQLARLNSMPDNEKAPAFGVNAVLRDTQAMQIHVGQNFLISN